MLGFPKSELPLQDSDGCTYSSFCSWIFSVSSNLPQWSLPFVFYNIKYIFLEKFSEILSRHAYVNVIVYLHGNTDAVALSDTKATGKHDLILNMIFLYGFFKKLYNILRALEMARRATQT